jgi:ketosteroid isomerase-like protein
MKKRELLMVVAAIAACTPADTTTTEAAGLSAADETAIRTLIRTAYTPENWGNCGSWNDFTAPDIFVANARGDEGVAEDVAGCEQFLTNNPLTFSSMTPTVLRVEGSGNIAYALTRFEARYETADGFLGTQSGHALWVMRRGDDGGWLRVAHGGGSSFVRD